jgi:hypothetical protein
MPKLTLDKTADDETGWRILFVLDKLEGCNSKSDNAVDGNLYAELHCILMKGHTARVREPKRASHLALSIPLILLQWGYTWPDICEWYRQLFFDFHIGNTQVSFAVLLASVIVFGAGGSLPRSKSSVIESAADDLPASSVQPPLTHCKSKVCIAAVEMGIGRGESVQDRRPCKKNKTAKVIVC